MWSITLGAWSYVINYFLLDCFFKLNEHQFALADFNQAQLLLGNKSTIDLAYRLCVTHYTLGMKAFRDKATPTALRHFTHAISHSPQTARLYTCRARTKYDLKVGRVGC